MYGQEDIIFRFYQKYIKMLFKGLNNMKPIFEKIEMFFSDNILSLFLATFQVSIEYNKGSAGIHDV